MTKKSTLVIGAPPSENQGSFPFVINKLAQAFFTRRHMSIHVGYIYIFIHPTRKKIAE